MVTSGVTRGSGDERSNLQFLLFRSTPPCIIARALRPPGTLMGPHSRLRHSYSNAKKQTTPMTRTATSNPISQLAFRFRLSVFAISALMVRVLSMTVLSNTIATGSLSVALLSACAAIMLPPAPAQAKTMICMKTSRSFLSLALIVVV